MLIAPPGTSGDQGPNGAGSTSLATLGRVVVSAAVVLAIVACGRPSASGASTPDGAASPSIVGSAVLADPGDSEHSPGIGIGVTRLAVMSAADAELPPQTLVWGAERTLRDVTVEVSGRPRDRLSSLGIILTGPADNLIGIEIVADPATSSGEAHLAIAIARLVVPSAEDWIRAGLAQPAGFHDASFAEAWLLWGPNVTVTESRCSILFITDLNHRPTVGATRLPSESAP